MIYKGIARGRTIELDEALPFEDGEMLEVRVEPVGPEPRRGSPEAVLRAIREPPYVTAEDVAELERAIEEGKRPLSKPIEFDKEA